LQMKRIIFLAIGVLILVSLVAAGCAKQEPTGLTLGEGEEVVSSCVTCHSDKATLKEVATQEPEVEKSEATSGEG